MTYSIRNHDSLACICKEIGVAKLTLAAQPKQRQGHEQRGVPMRRDKIGRWGQDKYPTNSRFKSKWLQVRNLGSTKWSFILKRLSVK